MQIVFWTNFSDEVNRNIAQSEIEGGVCLDDLPEGAVSEIETYIRMNVGARRQRVAWAVPHRKVRRSTSWLTVLVARRAVTTTQDVVCPWHLKLGRALRRQSVPAKARRLRRAKPCGWSFYIFTGRGLDVGHHAQHSVS
jgi:hypothetical protein